MIIELEKSIRPIFRGYSGNTEFKILFDTGTDCSAYTRSEEVFLRRFPNAKKLQCMYPIDCFCIDKDNLRSVYQIPEIKVGDIWIRNLPVVICPKENTTSEVILTSYIFRYIPLTISFERMQMKLLPERSSIDCLPKTMYSKKYNCEILTGTYVLAQEDIN